MNHAAPLSLEVFEHVLAPLMTKEELDGLPTPESRSQFVERVLRGPEALEASRAHLSREQMAEIDRACFLVGKPWVFDAPTQDEPTLDLMRAAGLVPLQIGRWIGSFVDDLRRQAREALDGWDAAPFPMPDFEHLGPSCEKIRVYLEDNEKPVHATGVVNWDPAYGVLELQITLPEEVMTFVGRGGLVYFRLGARGARPFILHDLVRVSSTTGRSLNRSVGFPPDLGIEPSAELLFLEIQRDGAARGGGKRK